MLYDQQGEVTGVGRRRFSHLIFDALPSDYVHSKFPDDKLVEDVKDQDIVCVPSMSMDPIETQKITGVCHYEERSLFAMLFLRHPTTRLVYITSTPLDERIVQYYLSLMSDISPSDVMRRLVFLSTNDSSARPLTTKIMERPRLIERIKNNIRPGKGCMLCFNTTQQELELAAQIGATLIGCDPQYDFLGSKSGSRDIFESCSIPHPAGVPLERNVGKLAKAICELLQKTPTLTGMVVKLDKGFSGHGNALLDLEPLAGKHVTPYDILTQMSKMKFACSSEKWENFQKKIEVLGAIAEEYITNEAASPSVQGYITQHGAVELLSTHDQVLNGQIYQGCTFPAVSDYSAKLNEYGLEVGEMLAKRGARGYYGVDFLVPKDSNEVYALEINLRLCGTTHPYFTMKLLTGGSYDKKTGLFYSGTGILKYYRATDNLHKPQYHGLLPADILDNPDLHHLRYSSSTQTGVVFHLLGALSEHGKLGLTAIADSREDAFRLCNEVEEILDRATSKNTHASLGQQSALVPRGHLSPVLNVLTYGNKADKRALRIFITVCIHGDEVCGIHAINQLIDEDLLDNMPSSLQLSVMCANPLAVQKGVRFVDQNLNRSILPHLFEAGGYESYRARTIANHIFDADIYLDIHSTSSSSPSMCLPAANTASETLACKLPVDYVIEELAHATEVRGTTIDWAYFHHKTAVSIECGQHGSREAVQVAKRTIQALLDICADTSRLVRGTPKVMRCIGREKVSPGFKFTRRVEPFNHVKRGEAIAEDDKGTISCPFDLYDGGALVIMPTAKPYLGEEAFFWVVPSV